MKFELDKERLKKAKEMIRKIDEKIAAWEIEKTNAKEELKTVAKKYHTNVRHRIENAVEQIKYYQKNRDNIEKAIRDKYIEI